MWRSERGSFLEKKQYRLEVAPAPLLLEDRNRTQEPSPSALMRVKEKTPFPLRFSNFFPLIISAQCTKNTISGTAKKNSRCNNIQSRRRRRRFAAPAAAIATQQQQMRRGGAPRTPAAKKESTKDDDVAQRCLALPSVSSKQPSCSFIHLHCYSSTSGHKPPARHVVVQGPFYTAWNSERHNDANWQGQTRKEITKL